jgi:hypothetical protein
VDLNHKGEPIEARPLIAFTALAASRWIETTGWSKKLVRTARATAPSRSKPARTPSPPNNPYPTTSEPPSTPSSERPLDTS